MLIKNITLAVFLLSTANAFSQGLDLSAARANKDVCEGADGYVHAVKKSPSPEIMALIDNVNKSRKAEYQSIADKTSGKLEDAEKAAAAMLKGKGACPQ